MKDNALLLESFSATLQAHRESVYLFLRRLMGRGRPFMLQSDIQDEYRRFSAEPEGAPLAQSELGLLLAQAQEAVIDPPWLYLAVRPSIARWRNR